ncbi:MAG: hypothetical protein CL626_03960 [Aurantimonas sp.]|nr:hypothetical protein [Aurantimonas sp.]
MIDDALGRAHAAGDVVDGRRRIAALAEGPGRGGQIAARTPSGSPSPPRAATKSRSRRERDGAARRGRAPVS